MIQLSVLLVMFVSVYSVRKSSGCGKENTFKPEELTFNVLSVNDSNGLTAVREYVYWLPSSYSSDVPWPLYFWYHGQYGSAKITAEARKNDATIGIFPQGMNDKSGKVCGSGWNTGPMGHDKQTCDFVSWIQSCCYASCREINVCTGNGAEANCGWTTCYDDGQFFADIYDNLTEELCIDLDRVYVGGFSNGAMLTHYLYSRFPRKFHAVLPANGLPLIGHLDVPEALKGVSMLMFNSRGDTLIPQAGGFAYGWDYESADKVLTNWADVNDCDEHYTDVKTPYDGGDENFSCVEWERCSSGGRVMHCNYDGIHTTWPDEGDAVIMWFLNQLGMLNVTKVQYVNESFL